MKTYYLFIPLVALYLVAAADAKPEQGSIEGVVLQGSDQTPVPGADVEVYSFESSWFNSDSTLMKARTDSNGHFSVALNQQSFTVVIAKKKGLSYAWKNLDENQSSVKLLLSEPEPFGGQVVDEGGQPISEALVQIQILSTSPQRDGQGEILRKPETFDLLSTQTDAQGQFVFSDFPVRTSMEIRIIKKEYAIFFGEKSSSRSYRFQTGATDHVFVLEPEAILEGKVIDSQTGLPVVDVSVKLSNRQCRGVDLFPKSLFRTNESGQFTFNGLWADSYRLNVDSSQKSYLRESKTVELEKGQIKRDFDISLSRGGVLDLLVKNAKTQQPIKEATISIQRKDKKFSGAIDATLKTDASDHVQWSSSFQSGQNIYKATLKTDASGHVQWRGLPGDYYVTELTALGYLINNTKHPLTIEDNKTKSMTLTMDEYPRLEGTIVYPDGSAAADVKVHLHYMEKMRRNARGFLIPSLGLPRVVRTDPNGHFAFWIDATAEEIEEDSEAYPVFAFTSKQNLFAVGSITFDQKNTPLQLKPGIKVAGSLVDQHGVAVEEGHVSLNVSVKTGPHSSFGTSISSVKPDIDGQFEFAGVPSDSHGLSLSFYEEGYRNFSGKVDPSQVIDRVIQLQPIPVHRADMIIKGKVIYPNGNPVDGASVSVTDYTAGYVSDVSDKQGCFELTVLELPVEISVSKTTSNPYRNHTAQVWVTEKDQAVTLTIYSKKDTNKGKEEFLPVTTPVFKKPFSVAGLLVLEKPAGHLDAQGMSAFKDDKWRNNEQLFYIGKPGHMVKVGIDIEQDGKYKILTRLTTARDYGIIQFYLNDQKVLEPIDLYCPDKVIATDEMALGEYELEKGQHVLTIEIVGANPAAIKRYIFGIDYLDVKKCH